MAIETDEKTKNAKKTKMIGARALIEALADEGVEVIFGYPGAATIPIHDVLMEGKIRHILTRHEQGAAHAADGYARATGKVGVCLATSGPGALNLVTGIATANMDSIPLVAITGQVATNKIGTDAFQESDTIGVTDPISKHNYLIKDVKDIPNVVHEAFHIASTGRPGPVVIDLPMNLSFAEVEYKRADDSDIRSYQPTKLGLPQLIKKASDLIDSSKRPVICAGGGIIASDAADELRKLVEKAGIPVGYTLMGKGAFPDNNRFNLGMLGMHGSAYANYAVKECDLLIAVGMRFSDRVVGKLSAFAPNAKIIHIDIDPAEIDKIIRPELPIIGDAKSTLFAIVENIKKSEHEKWLLRLEEWSKTHQPQQDCDDGRINPKYIYDAINDITNNSAIIVTDVGQHQMWAAQYCNIQRPRQFLSSGGLGTMGYGLPAAIGAQVGCPDQIVFAISGDGSIMMNIQEIMTAVEQHLPIKIALFNNGYLGMVRQWQQIFYDRRYASTDISAQPDFVMLAQAFGAAAFRVKSKDDILPVLKKSLEINDRPCFIDFQIAREACVLPMIPAGGTVDDILLELD